MDTLSGSQHQAQPAVAILRTVDAVSAAATQLVPIYQTAFAGEPWYEVSACAASPDFPNPCPSRRSPQAIGETCAECGGLLQAPAFSAETLTDGWISHFREHESRFYLERLKDESCVLAALAWRATPDAVADRCYASPSEHAMRVWLRTELPDRFVWLEDIFANRALRPSGNLWNYRAMVAQLLSELGGSLFAFRSINERLIQKTILLFNSRAQRLIGLRDVPDRRDIVLVRIST